MTVRPTDNLSLGLDFFYKTRAHAARLVDFLETVLPIRVKQSKQLVSHDQKNNTFFYKYGFAVELPKICRDDLVYIPKKLAKELGGIGQLQLCFKISQIIHLFDPLSMKTSELSFEQYLLYEKDFKLYNLKTFQQEFTVVDSERRKVQNLNESYISSSTNQMLQKICFVQVMDEDCQLISTRSHLGDVLKPGSTVLGFYVKNMVIEELESAKVPDVVLVRRKVDKESRKRRIFKLKRMEQQNQMQEEKQKKGAVDEEEQFEEFLDDVEKDRDMRKNMNLYRNEDNIAKLTPEELRNKEKRRIKKAELQNRKIIKTGKAPKQDDSFNNDSDDSNEVKLEELMKDLHITDDKQEPHEPNEDLDQFISKIEKVKIEK